MASKVSMGVRAVPSRPDSRSLERMSRNPVQHPIDHDTRGDPEVIEWVYRACEQRMRARADIDSWGVAQEVLSRVLRRSFRLKVKRGLIEFWPSVAAIVDEECEKAAASVAKET